MQAPVDYPIDDAARTAQFSIDELMYAALLDRESTSMPVKAEPTTVPQNLLYFDVEPDKAAKRKTVPPPLTAIAQTLLAGERANAAAGVFSRLTRTNR